MRELPQGFILEETVDQSSLPPGFQIEGVQEGVRPGLLGGPDASIGPAKEQSWIEKLSAKIGGMSLQTPEESVAQAQNIYAISKETGAPMLHVEKHIDELSRKSSITGIKPGTLTRDEYTALVVAPFIASGVVAAPVATAIRLTAFAAVDKVFNLSDWIPENSSDTTKTFVNLLDLTVKGGIVGGGDRMVSRKGPAFMEKYFQNKVKEMKLPEKFTLTRNQVADIFKTGKLTSAEQKGIFAGLNLTRNELKVAVRKGLDIEVPGEMIIKMVDKPGWSAFKKVTGVKRMAEMFPKDPLLRAAVQNRVISEPITGAPAAPGEGLAQIEHTEIPEGFVIEKNEGYIKGVVEKFGGKFKQIQSAEDSMYGEEAVWYDTPSGSTQAIPRSKFTEELVQEKITASEKEFEEGRKKKIEEISARKKKEVLPSFEALRKKAVLLKDDALVKRIDKKIAEISKKSDITPKKEKVTPDSLEAALKNPSGPALSAPSVAGVWKNKVPVEMGKESLKKLKPAEFPELVRLAKDLMGAENLKVKRSGSALGRFKTPPQEGSILLNPELFKRGNEQHLAITLAHEIGHLTDYLPDETLKRGNLLGRIHSLKKYMKNTFGESLVKNTEIREELKKITQILHPFDRKTSKPSYVKYRDSSVELYAEAISMLLNSPGTIEGTAPNFTKVFFENLDKKPTVKLAFFELQEILNGKPADLLARREGDIRKMFVKGEELRRQMQNEKELAKVSYWERLRQLVDDINHPIIAKRQKAEGKGDIFPSEKSPEYELEERSLADNDKFMLIADIDKRVFKPLTAAGLTREDLGMYTFLKRVQGRPETPLQGDAQTPMEELLPFDEVEIGQMKQRFFDVVGRKDIANPLGFSPKTAAVQMDNFAKALGPEKFAELERAGRELTDVMWPIIEEAVRVGSFSKDVFNKVIKPNKGHYVAFGVLNYLQEYVPATVKLQKGTLKEIENPIDTTILKMLSLTSLNARQRAVNQLRDWLKGSFPTEIIEAKKDIKGKFIKPAFSTGMELVHLLEDGKLNAYQIDKYIAKSVENSKNGDVMLVGHMINKVFGNQIFKNLYITYNPGFAFAFNPVRDFKRTYANLNALGQKTSVLNLLKAYAESLPSALRRQRGIEDATIREMMKTHTLDIPFIDFNFDIHGDSYNSILKQLGILKGEEHMYSKMMKPLLKPVLQVMEGVRFAGSTLESLSKVAGYNILKNDPSLSTKKISYATRNYVGTPNYRRGGTITSATNAIWMFSNIMKEGLKSDLQLATSPKTKSGFWWSHFKVNMLPKFLMFAAASGLIGKELKKAFDDVSEYDKTNYIVLPVGKDKNDKTVYFRIPHDESGRLMSAIFWKVLDGVHKKDPKKVQQIFAFGAGQMPGLAPGIELTGGWMQYLSGKNPYDAFRGQYIVSDQAWKAGGWPRLKKMVQWTANNTGLLQFATYSDAHNSTFESTVRTLPAINKILKVSDYGVTEKLKNQRKSIESRQAKRTLLKRDLIDKGNKKVAQGETFFSVSKDIAGKVYGKASRQNVKTIQKAMKQESERGKNVYLDMLMTARSNEEKELILREMTDMYDPTTMRKIEREAIRLKAVSAKIIFKVRRSK